MRLLPKKGLILLLLIAIGGFLRFYNLAWDNGHFFHPDERYIPASAAQIHFFDQLNPNFFVYGSFPIYLFRALGDFLVFVTKSQIWTSGLYLNFIGRGLSAFLSTLTIFLIFLLGKKMADEKVGLLAAFLVAFTVGAIQFAHYSTTESLLIFWLLLLTLFSLDLVQKPTLKNYLKIGVILGLAVATKMTALLFLATPLVAHLTSQIKAPKYHLKFLLAIIVGLITFTIFSPYVFLEFQKFVIQMRYETNVATQTHAAVYVLQFEDTTPYLYQLGNFFWQMGPVALAGILGIIILSVIAVKRRDKNLIIFLSFPLLYYLWSGQWYAKHVRYTTLLLPFLSLSAAWLLFEIQKIWGRRVITLASFVTFLWALAFFSIYTREQTRITASKWIYQNIPPGAKILSEHWDNRLPLDLPPNLSNIYRVEPLDIYQPDNEEKINYYANQLSQADYLILASRRLYGTLIHLPELYPLTSHYYRLLFAGELGYTKINQFTSYPRLLGFEINDDKSEETFQVFDHPKVLIFENTVRLPESKLKKILTDFGCGNKPFCHKAAP